MYKKEYKIAFNPSSKIHKSYLINEWLRSIGQDDKILPEWSEEDISLIEYFYGPIDYSLKEQAMNRLAEDKRQIYLKTVNFNLNSPKQIRNLFTWLGYKEKSYDQETLRRILTNLELDEE